MFLKQITNDYNADKPIKLKIHDMNKYYNKNRDSM